MDVEKELFIDQVVNYLLCEMAVNYGLNQEEAESLVYTELEKLIWLYAPVKWGS